MSSLSSWWPSGRANGARSGPSTASQLRHKRLSFACSGDAPREMKTFSSTLPVRAGPCHSSKRASCPGSVLRRRVIRVRGRGASAASACAFFAVRCFLPPVSVGGGSTTSESLRRAARSSSASSPASKRACMSAAHCRNAASRRPMPVPEDGAGQGAPATGDAAGRAVPFASPSARCPADAEETAPGTGAGLPSGMRASPGTAGDVPPFSPASGTEAFPLPATGAAVVPPPRRRPGELLPSAGVASGTGAAGAAAAKGAAAGTGSGKEAAGTVSVT